MGVLGTAPSNGTDKPLEFHYLLLQLTHPALGAPHFGDQFPVHFVIRKAHNHSLCRSNRDAEVRGSEEKIVLAHTVAAVRASESVPASEVRNIHEVRPSAQAHDARP